MSYLELDRFVSGVVLVALYGLFETKSTWSLPSGTRNTDGALRLKVRFGALAVIIWSDKMK